MDVIRRTISALNIRRKRIWRIVKKKCKLSRRNRFPDSACENMDSIHDVEVKLISVQ